MSATTWEKTRLWELLIRRGDPAKQARRVIESILPNAERVLRKGGTTPLDFTLHDDEHAFRVAERMFDILPMETHDNLSDLELLHLLLSAYLHDIGMTPLRERWSAHFDYLTSRDKANLNDRERMQFESWIDTERPDLSPHCLQLPRMDAHSYSVLYDVLSDYFRSRHNDYSADWIRNHLSENPTGTSLFSTDQMYPGWVDDLVKLCRSHHEGYDDLASRRFDAMQRGSPSRLVNLRYLAAILRLADILDISPDRAPLIILQHRSTRASGILFWQREAEITITICLVNHDVRLPAQPSTAKLYRATMQVHQYINAELYCCHQLEQQRLYTKAVPRGRDHYRWPWPPAAALDVREKDGRFKYIEGAFRPNPTRLISLLGGLAIYSDPIVAVRELLQNALDAVSELIARQRLQRTAPSDPSWELVLGRSHEVKLSIEARGDRYWLICSDTGAGMTSAIIERFLLVSGTGLRPDVRMLVRKCEEAGFRLHRTGQFGIGVLSYFLLGDTIVFTTQRCVEHGRPEPRWRFTIDSLEDFGELQDVSAPSSSNGTSVELRLREEIVNGRIDEFQTRLVDYVRETVSKTPCLLEIHSYNNDVLLSMPCPGWQPLYLIAAQLTNYDFDIRLAEVSETWLGRDVRRLDVGSALWELVQTKLRCDLYDEGTIPEARASYRVSVWSFDNTIGRSLSFFRDVPEIDHVNPESGRSSESLYGGLKTNIKLRPRIMFSVNGFRSEPSFSPHVAIDAFPLVQVEVDFLGHQSSLSVGRERFAISKDEAYIVNVAIQHATRAVLKRYVEQAPSDTTAPHDIGLISGAYPGIGLGRSLSLTRFDAFGRMVHASEGNMSSALPVATLDACLGGGTTTERSNYRFRMRSPLRRNALLYKLGDAAKVIDLSRKRDREHWMVGLCPTSCKLQFFGCDVRLIIPRHLFAGGPYLFGVGRLWEGEPIEISREAGIDRYRAVFPATWKDVLLFHGGATTLVVNRDHNLFQSFGHDEWQLADDLWNFVDDPRDMFRHLSGNRARTIAWVVRGIAHPVGWGSKEHRNASPLRVCSAEVWRDTILFPIFSSSERRTAVQDQVGLDFCDLFPMPIRYLAASSLGGMYAVEMMPGHVAAEKVTHISVARPNLFCGKVPVPFDSAEWFIYLLE